MRDRGDREAQRSFQKRRLWNRLWLAGSLVLLGGMGCFLGCGGGSDRQEAATLRGKVVDAANPNRVVAGAQVRVEGTRTVVTTGADGSYQLVGLPNGPVNLVVELPEDSKYKGMRLQVNVPPGEVLDLDITLLPDDLAEEPAQIELQPTEYTLGLQESVQFQALVTSSSGNYVHVHPTWTVVMEGHAPPVGVVSREGIFIGTAVGVGKVVVQVGALKDEATVRVVADEELARIVVAPPWDLVFLPEGQEQLLLAFGINGAGQMFSGFRPEWEVEPAGLGTLTPVTDLSAEELERLLAEYGVLGPDFPIGWKSDGSPPASRRKAASRHIEVLPEAVSVQRFTAGNSGGQGWVTVAFGGQTASLEIQVQARGILTEVSLEPQAAKVPVGRTVNFFAWGLNEEGQPIPGLEFEWKLAVGLGDLQEIYFYGDAAGSGSSPAGGSASRKRRRLTAPSAEQRPLSFWDDGSSGRAFTARTEGQDRLTVTVHDPVAKVTLQATAEIVVTPVPLLEKLRLTPEEATVAPGGEVSFWAQALDELGEPVSAVLEWAITKGLGVLKEAPVPLMDGCIPGLRPEDCLWPWPPEGFDARLLIAAEKETTGTVTVTAVQKETNRTASAQARVTIGNQ